MSGGMFIDYEGEEQEEQEKWTDEMWAAAAAAEKEQAEKKAWVARVGARAAETRSWETTSMAREKAANAMANVGVHDGDFYVKDAIRLFEAASNNLNRVNNSLISCNNNDVDCTTIYNRYYDIANNDYIAAKANLDEALEKFKANNKQTYTMYNYRQPTSLASAYDPFD